MNPNIRMLAIDMDGTLLHDDTTISPYTHDILTQALAAGVRVVVATGRMFCSARQLATELGLGDVPLVTYSGGLIAKCISGEILYHAPIPLATAREIVATACELDAFVHAYVHDELWVRFRDRRVDDYEKRCRIEAKVIGAEMDALAAAPTKLLINEPDPQKIARIAKVLREKFAGRVHFVQSSPMFFEMVAPHVSKGVAVEQLGLRYGISMKQTMGFGNAQNDFDLLRAVGWPVAVANAVPELKAVARYIAPSNNEDGVAKTVAKYVLEANDGR